MNPKQLAAGAPAIYKNKSINKRNLDLIYGVIEY
jgi:hypothetical protein